MLPRRGIIVLVILLAALTCMVWQHPSVWEARRALVKAEADRAELDQRIVAARSQNETSRRQLSEQRKLVETTRASVAESERQLAQADPEARWATPPNDSAGWDDTSPYLWISKSMLPKLPVEPFTKKAELRGDVAATLAMDTNALRSLNKT
jgi:hypothetical protein